jgi:hypothetical protein
VYPTTASRSAESGRLTDLSSENANLPQLRELPHIFKVDTFQKVAWKKQVVQSQSSPADVNTGFFCVLLQVGSSLSLNENDTERETQAYRLRSILDQVLLEPG